MFTMQSECENSHLIHTCDLLLILACQEVHPFDALRPEGEGAKGESMVPFPFPVNIHGHTQHPGLLYLQKTQALGV